MEYLEDNALNIFTDGSSYSGPRRGGIGMLFVTVDEDGHEQVHDFTPPGGYAGATNNQMELQACIEALRIATKSPPVDPTTYTKVVIRTDSDYVASNFATAKFGWSRTGWTTRDGAPVLNAHLWKELLKLVRRAEAAGKRVEIRWVRGKSSAHTKAVDKAAKRAAKGPSDRRVSVVRVRRKQSPRSLERGSVRMEGQRATIRIVADEYLPIQRKYKYTYEVMSRASLYYQCVDVVFSSAPMDRGHCYYVRFNSDTRNPTVEKVFREVACRSSRSRAAATSSPRRR